MSALRDLELRYDGPIPAELRCAAMAEDFAVARADRPRVRFRVKALKPAGVIQRMAEVMRAAALKRGRCYRQDLAEAGFSTSQIDAYAEDARALAARQAEAAGERREVEIPIGALLRAARRIA
jgi:hypothetical protein